MHRFVTSDIHGCQHTFDTLLDRLAFSRADELYLLGDYVDRGPDSKGVIDMIWEYQKAGYRIHCLRGNHEDLVLRAASHDYTFLERWLQDDGKATMDSFGVRDCADIPAEYLNWMRSLPYFLEVDNYILVHAGFDFSLADPLSDPAEMAWIRFWYDTIRYDWLGERIILHGHTPVDREALAEQHRQLEKQQYLDLDNGCVFAEPRLWKRPGLGGLAVFDLDSQKLEVVENVDVGW